MARQFHQPIVLIVSASQEAGYPIRDCLDQKVEFEVALGPQTGIEIVEQRERHIVVLFTEDVLQEECSALKKLLEAIRERKLPMVCTFRRTSPSQSIEGCKTFNLLDGSEKLVSLLKGIMAEYWGRAPAHPR